MIPRDLTRAISEKIHKGKTIILMGPRQVGKTTLVKSILENEQFLFLDGDDPTVRSLLNDPNTLQLKSILGSHQIVFIDEAQRIQNIGITLKIINDQFQHIQLIVSGSSAFELGNTTSEPLTGRKWEYKLYPISWKELENHIGFVEAEQQVELRMIYGMYPDIINNIGNEVDILKNLTDSYLYKDILAYSGIRKSVVLENLLKALALQIGNEVSYNELAQLIGVDKNTVSNYISILEQAYVVFRLHSFSRNLRNEIKTNQKVYFYDTGVRNAIIGNFNSLEIRGDKGALWENFMISERIKKIAYDRSFVQSFFWRTKQQQEIDYVEEIAGQVTGYEFKWKATAKAKIPKTFIDTYHADVNVIHRENFREFLLP